MKYILEIKDFMEVQEEKRWAAMLSFTSAFIYISTPFL